MRGANPCRARFTMKKISKLCLEADTEKDKIFLAKLADLWLGEGWDRPVRSQKAKKIEPDLRLISIENAA